MGLSIMFCLSVVFFVGMTIRRAWKYAKQPVHLRWELHPGIAKKGHPGGGSYFEAMNGGSRPRKRNPREEIKFIGREILFFRMYFRQKKKYWLSVYPFHLGVFLMFGWWILLLTGSLLSTTGVLIAPDAPRFLGRAVHYLTILTGGAGMGLSAMGTVGLLWRRSRDAELRMYSSPKDYFTLAFMLAVLFSGAFAWIFQDPFFQAIRGFVTTVITWSPGGGLNAATTVYLILFSLFVLYAPFTRMMHFVAKYFTFHAVLWDEAAPKPGSRLQKKIEKQGEYRISWSASHLRPGETWRQEILRTDDASEKATQP